jgi:hypothetical protein
MNIYWDILNFGVSVDTMRILYWLIAFASEKCQDPAATIGVLLSGYSGIDCVFSKTM